MFKVKKTEFIISATKPQNYPVEKYPEVVLLGRSNVGKSTFINSFVNNKKTAYVSSVPGKTQVINFFLINDQIQLVDVPGYGYAKVSKKRREEFGKMIETYLTKRSVLKFAVLLVDFKVGATADDIMMYEFLKYYDIQTLVVATKKDKVNKGMFSKHKQNILDEMNILDQENLIIYSKNDHNSLNEVYKYFEQEFGE